MSCWLGPLATVGTGSFCGGGGRGGVGPGRGRGGRRRRLGARTAPGRYSRRAIKRRASRRGRTPLARRRGLTRRLRGTGRRVRRRGSGCLHLSTRFSGCHGHAVGRGTRLVLGNNRGDVDDVLPVISSFRHTLGGVRATASMTTMGRNIRLVCGGFVSMLKRGNIGMVRAGRRPLSASCRRTVTIVPTPGRTLGNGVLSYMRANCVLGSGIVHRTGIMIKRWRGAM